LTLFTYDLGIETISTVLDLFMIEGFKCLIKFSLAVLNFIYKIYNDEGDYVHVSLHPQDLAEILK
jgi:hypothetical protein